ncbi:DUF6551 family protein [Streptomyces parvulus]|uniref:Uncharacterized protein n=1 Tax=Streptomyces parvulus TaxID=146923 RepID=A0A191UYM5_9ACTN|nr:DUF6551 family protein [Streptomyces parvulus]ANJ07760.1 hypothetical protein Spa2297_12610 [Streptomyces parvulus]GGR70838.1 hypothetical protein GCM10010220_23720 [Streptomyces parvulus]
MPSKDYSYDIPDHPIKYMKVDPRTIKFDARSQRQLNKPRARTMAEKLVPTALGTPILSQRADGKYAVDGMHRVYACQLILAGEVKVPKRVREAVETINCEVHFDLSTANEASLFIIKNKESSKVGPNDEFRIGVLAGHPLFVDTDTVLEKHQLKVGSRTTNGVRGIKGILDIVAEHGPDILDLSLTIAEGAWGRHPDTWHSVTLGGIAIVVSKHPDVVKPKELAEKLKRQGDPTSFKAKIQTIATNNNTRADGTKGRLKAAHLSVAAAWNASRRAETNRIPVPNIFE